MKKNSVPRSGVSCSACAHLPSPSRRRVVLRCHQELPWFKQSAQFKSIETRNRGPLKLGTLSVENSDLDLLRHQAPGLHHGKWCMSKIMENMKAPITEPCLTLVAWCSVLRWRCRFPKFVPTWATKRLRIAWNCETFMLLPFSAYHPKTSKNIIIPSPSLPFRLSYLPNLFETHACVKTLSISTNCCQQIRARQRSPEQENCCQLWYGASSNFPCPSYSIMLPMGFQGVKKVVLDFNI